MNKTPFYILFLCALSILTACSTLPLPPTPTTPAIPPAPPASATPLPSLPPAPEGDVMPPAVLTARKALAEHLKISLNQVELLSMTPVSWPDACLGLPQKGEACAEVITPGYRLIFRVLGQSYPVHTSSTSTAVRIAPQIVTPPIPVAEKARQDLAQKLRTTPESITILEVEEQNWPDSCLGIKQKNVQCLQVITPGFQITLEHQGKVYTYHANRTGSAVVLASSEGSGTSAPAEPVLSWKSPGSDCQSALITPTTIQLGPCNMPQINLLWDHPEYQADYRHYVETFRSFTATTRAGSLQFTGYGSRQAAPSEQRAIAEWAAMAVAAAARPKGSLNQGLALHWHREGGIAGFCDDLLIYRSGVALPSTCRGSNAQKLPVVFLSAVQLDQLYAWIDTFNTFSFKPTDTAKADSMRISVLFNGDGSRAPDETVRQAMLTFSQQVYAQVILTK